MADRSENQSAKQIKWPRYPLVEHYDLTDPVSDAELLRMTQLFPNCNLASPPWNEIKTELVEAGYLWPDELCSKQFHQLLRMLKEARRNR